MEIHIWYGDRQNFTLGQPQRWVNILGTVTDPPPDMSMRVKLNDGMDQQVSIGPDGLRLRGVGDFNIELATTDLVPGENVVTILGSDSTGTPVSKKMRVVYTPDKTWPLPYQVRWNQVQNIPDAVQVVEGNWLLTSKGIRPVNPAYDRLIVLGDNTWTDYYVRLAITVHKFVPGEQGDLQGGFGILTRWTGHYADGNQPSHEWRPSGAIGWYRARWEDKPPRWRNLNISDAVIEDRAMVETPSLVLEPDHEVIMQMRVKTREGNTSHYTYKVWYPEEPQKLLCDLDANGTPGESPQGSILLIALFADVTIGDIDCYPL